MSATGTATRSRADKICSNAEDKVLAVWPRYGSGHCCQCCLWFHRWHCCHCCQCCHCRHCCPAVTSKSQRQQTWRRSQEGEGEKTACLGLDCSGITTWSESDLWSEWNNGSPASTIPVNCHASVKQLLLQWYKVVKLLVYSLALKYLLNFQIKPFIPNHAICYLLALTRSSLSHSQHQSNKASHP